MDSKYIIDAIDEFFRTADGNVLAEVDAALSVKIAGDISFEEYVSTLSDEYFYTKFPTTNKYVYSDKRLKSGGVYYHQLWVEDFESNYEESDIAMSPKMESGNNGEVVEMIKKAA